MAANSNPIVASDDSGVYVVPVADGIARQGEWGAQGRLKISLVLAPDPANADLAHWPTQISQLVKDKRLRVKFYDKDKKAAAEGEFFGDSVYVHPASLVAMNEAQKLWEQIFITEEYFKTLKQVLSPAPRTLPEALNIDSRFRFGSGEIAVGRLYRYDATRILETLGGWFEGVERAQIRERLSRPAIAERLRGAGEPPAEREAVLASEALAPFRFPMARRLAGALAMSRLASGAPSAVAALLEPSSSMTLPEIIMRERVREDLALEGSESIRLDGRAKDVRDAVMGLRKLLGDVALDPALPDATNMRGVGDLVEGLLLGEGGRSFDGLKAILDKELLPPLRRLLGDRARAEEGPDFRAVREEIEALNDLGTYLAWLQTVRVEEFRAAFAGTTTTPQKTATAQMAETAALPLVERVVSERQWLEAQQEQAVRAKYAGIRSHPTLAKFLRFIVDVQVSGDKKLPTAGFISASFAQTMPEDGPCSAYVIDAPLFRPATYDELKATPPSGATAIAKALPLKSGVVNLGVPNRFRLTEVDIAALSQGQRTKAQHDRDQQLNGAEPDTLSARLPETRGRGLQLLDKDAHKSTLARLVAASSKDDWSKTRFFAEDLVLGYRVDIRRWRRRTREWKPWRTLMARSVTYEGIGQRYGAWSPYAEFAEREHGYLRVLDRLEKANDTDKGKELIDRPIAASHVFTWLGDSLGMPPPPPDLKPDLKPDQKADGKSETITDPTQHLGVGMEYRPSGLCPALRVGDGYLVGLRPAYINGGGPTLAEAAVVYDKQKPSLTLGDPEQNGKEYLFGRPNDVGAPIILVDGNDPLASSVDPSRFANETHERIVLRTGDVKQEEAVVRFLVPPRADFTRAEQFGIFDVITSDKTPDGAFMTFELRHDTGDFPGGQASENQTQETQNRVLVLRYKGKKIYPDRPYYPDPMARNLGIAFERGGTFADGFPQLAPPHVFWENDKRAEAVLEAKPIQLEFRRWPNGRSGGRFNRERAEAVLKASGEKDLSIRRLCVEIAPAEDVTVWLWCWPDLPLLIRARPRLATVFASALVKQNPVIVPAGAASGGPLDVLNGLDARAGFTRSAEGSEARVTDFLEGYFRALALEEPEFEKRFASAHLKGTERAARPEPLMQFLRAMSDVVRDAVFRPSPFNGITGWTKIRVVHAVVQPLLVPKIALATSGQPDFGAIRLLADKSWEEVVTKMVGSPPVAAESLHDPSGTRCHFYGSLDFDRASTGAIRVEANWADVSYSAAVRKRAGESAYKDLPPRVDKLLFEIKEVPRDPGPPSAHSRNTSDRIDLLRDELGQLRGLIDGSGSGSAFSGPSSTAACELSLRIVATSRFTADFNAERGPVKSGDLGKFEVATRATVGLETSPNRPVPQEAIDYTIRLPATVRPPRPVVKRIDWMAPEQRRRVSSKHLMVRKSFHPRLYLDNSYRVSGEHELIAVVLAPSRVVDARPYDPKRQSASVDLDFPHPLGPVAASHADELARIVAKDMRLNPMLCSAEEKSDLCPGDYAAVLPLVTRWGVDPSAAPMGRVEALMSATRFRGHVASYPSVRVPKPGVTPTSTDPAAFVETSVLLYKPELDPETGEWFVDIGIDPGAAHAPFVKLSIARYQPYHLRYANDAAGRPFDLSISEALLLDPIRVPACRTVELFDTPNQSITVHVYGVGYTRREPQGVSQAVRHLTDTPMQNVELVRMAGSGGQAAPVRVFDRAGMPVRRSRVAPIAAGPMLSWICQLALPVRSGPERYGIVIDEIDMHVPDEVIDSSQRAQAPSDLIERPSFFSLAVALDADLPLD